MGTVKLKDFRSAVLASQTKALAKLRDIAMGKLHETYWHAYEQQLREAGRLLQVIDANPDAAIASLSAPQSGDWVLVPREPTPEMLSAAGRLQACECGFVGDMSPMDGEEYAAMLAAAPQPPAEAHCATCSCVPGMTPAVRFDTTPAEKEGAVRDHLIRMGWTPPAEAQAVGGGEEGFKAWVVEQMPAGTVIDNPAWWADRLAQAYAANVPQPPSAPVGVGVDAMRRAAEELRRADALANKCGKINRRKIIGRAADNNLSVILSALAQQPAAVDDLMNAWREAFIAERATRYREGGMKIEQARIHAETDAARIYALAAAAKGVGND